MTGRIPGPGAPSRGTWPGTPGNSDCSVSRTASHTSPAGPAARLKLTDRGLVREGYAADLVLFDPDRIADTATFTEPRQQAAGIDYVLVNGQLAIDEAAPTGSRSGRALRLDKEGSAVS